MSTGGAEASCQAQSCRPSMLYGHMICTNSSAQRWLIPRCEALRSVRDDLQAQLEASEVSARERLDTASTEMAAQRDHIEQLLDTVHVLEDEKTNIARARKEIESIVVADQEAAEKVASVHTDRIEE